MTPCEKAGLKVGDKIRVLSDGHFHFNKGDVVTLKEDDGSDTPYFYPREDDYQYDYISFGIDGFDGCKWEKVK